MSLTLGNDLTGTVAREVDAANRRAAGLGESMTTGVNKFVEVVDAFLGNSLRDAEVVLGAVAKNTAYSVNLLTITDEYLSTIASALQQGLKTVASAGSVSADKIAVMQKNLNDKISQVNLLIKTADFDGKGVLSGGAIGIDVQVGLSITDKLTLNVKDFGGGKLLRIGAATAINDYLGADVARMTKHATSAALTNAIALNENFANLAAIGDLSNVQLSAAIDATRTGNASFTRLNEGNLVGNLNAEIEYGAALWENLAAGGGVGGAINTNANTQIAARNAIVAGMANGDSKAVIGVAVEAAVFAIAGAVVGGGAQFLAHAAPANTTILTATPAELVTALNNSTAAVAIGGVVGNSARVDLQALFTDNQATDLSTSAGRSKAQDVLQSALNSVRSEQAAVSNQRSNVVESADALRATTNVTQKAADSYLKTDYVLTAQQYSETIRTMVASITALQAANKIPEAAQRLIDSLAR